MKHKATAFGIVAAGVVTVQGLIPVVAHATSDSNIHTSFANASTIQYEPTTISITGQAALHPAHIVAYDPWSGKPTSWISVNYLQEALKSVGVQTVC